MKRTFAGSTCPAVLEVQQTLRFTFNDCDIQGLPLKEPLRLQGVAEREARGEVAVSPTRVEIITRTQALLVKPLQHPALRVSGSLSLTRTRAEPTRMDVAAQAWLSREGPDPLDLRFYVAGDARTSGLCLTLEGLGYSEGSIQLVVAPKALRYCTQLCPDTGDLVIAGHHLQRLRFTSGSAVLSLDEGPYAPVQDALPCSTPLP